MTDRCRHGYSGNGGQCHVLCDDDVPAYEPPETGGGEEGEAGRCDLVCSHGDQCTLLPGHDDGHNFRVCDCNGPLRSLAEIAAADVFFEAIREAALSNPAALFLHLLKAKP